jgi:hypothetical protein
MTEELNQFDRKLKIIKTHLDLGAGSVSDHLAGGCLLGTAVTGVSASHIPKRFHHI